MADQIIDGEQYEKELLDLTRQHTTGINEQNLSKDEVAELFASAADGRGVTDTEKKPWLTSIAPFPSPKLPPATLISALPSSEGASWAGG
jgi:hypothetical protein